VHRARKLPVQPLPLGDRWDRHVHRTQSHRDGDDQRGRGGTGSVCGRLDGQWRQVAGNAGEKGYLGVGDGPAACSPLAAEGKVVEGKRLQIAAEYRTKFELAALTYGNFRAL
jgi:hypothetical protein